MVGSSQLWPLWPACSWNQARSYLLDLIFHIWFGSRVDAFFPFRTVSGLDHHYWIWIRCLFVHLVWFQYQCTILDPLGLNEARSDPPCGKTDWGHIQHFNSWPVVVTWSESDPFFAHLTRFLYECIIQDPLGLNKARSDRLPAKQIRTTSGISIQGQMVIAKSDLDPIRFLYIWPGSSIDAALSRIRLDWVKQDLICLWRNRSELHLAFLFRAVCSWPDLNQIRYCTSGLVLISVCYPGRICSDWTKPDLTHFQRNRSGPYLAFLFRAGCSWPDLN